MNLVIEVRSEIFLKKPLGHKHLLILAINRGEEAWEKKGKKGILGILEVDRAKVGCIM